MVRRKSFRLRSRAFICSDIKRKSRCNLGNLRLGNAEVNAVWTGRNNETIAWLYPEHCLTLIGFDQSNGTVTVSDDGTGTSYSISMSTFVSVFKGMGSQAVILKKK